MVKDGTSSCILGHNVALGGSQEGSISAEVQQDKLFSFVLGQQLFDRQQQSYGLVCSSLCHDMEVHSPSRLAWMSTVVLVGLFFSRGDETEFWYILGAWMQ